VVKLPVSRFVAYGLLALILVTTAGIVAAHYWPDLRWVAAPVTYDAPLPRVARETKIITKMVPQVVTREVVVYKPSPAQQEKIEDRYDLKLDEVGREILTEVDTGKLAHGGTALVTINEQGEAEVKIAAKRAPFFELGGPFEVGGGLAYSSELGQGLTIHAGKDLFRVWKVTTKVEADLDIHAGKTYGRAAVLGVVRF
jgi:hypothetical protein